MKYGKILTIIKSEWKACGGSLLYFLFFCMCFIFYKKKTNFLWFFFLDHAVGFAGSQFPNQDWTQAQQWKYWVLNIGLLGISQNKTHF